MAVNKVVYGGKTLVDLTGDTVTAATLAKGVTAHDKSGAKITGTMQATKPTQFTNLYDPSNVTLDYRMNCSSSSGIVYAVDTETNYLLVPYHHAKGDTVAIRLRGISTVRSRLDFVLLNANKERVNHAQWNSYVSNMTYDEYGDVVITFSSGFVVTSEWYYIMFNFQYPFHNSASKVFTGCIVTINEPIGNGGYAG